MSASDPAPYYHAHIFCCTNQRAPGHKRGCCFDKGAEDLRNYMKKRAKELGLEGVRVNTAGCLDRCELGPCIVIYPEGIWYSPKNEADVDEILMTHLQNDGRVTRLMLTPDQKPAA
jgi:(2Fe-2S) ferredoxin